MQSQLSLAHGLVGALVAAAVIAIEPTQAATVRIEYTGRVLDGRYVGQTYTADYVFNTNPANPYSSLSSSTENYVEGGTYFGPTYTSPAVSASLTIGASIFVPTAPSSLPASITTAFTYSVTSFDIVDGIFCDIGACFRLEPYILTETLLDTGTTPLPAALPLFASGLGGLGLLGWRRKKKAQAIAA